MISYTEAYIGEALFSIKYETESETRTRILSIDYQGLPIDIEKIQTMSIYYKPIRNAVDEAAAGYWNSKKMAQEVFNEAPTLAYQKVLKNQMDMITKALFLVVILLASLTSFSQAYVNIGGGVAKVITSKKVPDCTVPVMKISAGYQFSNIFTEALMQPSISRITNSPNYFGVKAGYNIHGFIPSIGTLYNYCNADDVTMNRWEVGYALKYQFPVGPNGGLFVEALYTKSSYQLITGFNIQL